MAIHRNLYEACSTGEAPSCLKPLLLDPEAGLVEQAHVEPVPTPPYVGASKGKGSPLSYRSQ